VLPLGVSGHALRVLSCRPQLVRTSRAKVLLRLTDSEFCWRGLPGGKAECG
jgi:hypothetical protein